VQFTLRVQRGSDMGSLVACVSHAGQRLRYSLGLSHIPVRYWDEVRQRMFPRSPRAEEVNKEIDRNMEVILFYFTAAAGDTNEPPSLDGLQTRLFPNHHNISTHTEKHSVISMFNRFIREHSNGGRPLSEGYPGSSRARRGWVGRNGHVLFPHPDLSRGRCHGVTAPRSSPR
jgi:hypothetical protein